MRESVNIKVENPEKHKEDQRKRLVAWLRDLSGIDVNTVWIVVEGFQRLFGPKDERTESLKLGTEVTLDVIPCEGKLFEDGEDERYYWKIPADERDIASRYTDRYMRLRDTIKYAGTAGVRRIAMTEDSYRKLLFPGDQTDIPAELQLGKVLVTTNSLPTTAIREAKKRTATLVESALG